MVYMQTWYMMTWWWRVVKWQDPRDAQQCHQSSSWPCPASLHPDYGWVYHRVTCSTCYHAACPSSRGSRHHARVAPAAVARAAVHVVRVRCPLLVWIPTTQNCVNHEFASKCEQIYLNWMGNLHVVNVASVAHSDSLLDAVSWQRNLHKCD